jgi:hypothetical protein
LKEKKEEAEVSLRERQLKEETFDALFLFPSLPPPFVSFSAHLRVLIELQKLQGVRERQ